MAEWQEKGDGRIGNIAEPFDEPLGQSSRNPKKCRSPTSRPRDFQV